jgi:hypothetical protein
MTHQADSVRDQAGRSLEEIDPGEMDAVTGGCQSCGCASAGGAKPQSAMAPARNSPATRGR